ncbi:MAG: IS200/IS605 family transposase [Pirellulales bacterium]|nr:IS200/IS605 family transposase [Pirellulales bacterium]
MPQSLANALMHIVFSTKERRALLQVSGLREEMHRYLAGVSAKLDCPAVTVGGTSDHIHLLADQSRTIALAEWVKELKRASSLWAKKRDPQWSLFQWQAGYGAFAVSHSQKSRVWQYIDSQEEHHRRLSFQDELRQLLAKHNITFDERYVWD